MPKPGVVLAARGDGLLRQATIVLIVVLVQELAPNNLLSPASPGDILTEIGMRAAEVTKYW